MSAIICWRTCASPNRFSVAPPRAAADHRLPSPAERLPSLLAREHDVVEAVREEDDLLAALHGVERAWPGRPWRRSGRACAAVPRLLRPLVAELDRAHLVSPPEPSVGSASLNARPTSVRSYASPSGSAGRSRCSTPSVAMARCSCDAVRRERGQQRQPVRSPRRWRPRRGRRGPGRRGRSRARPGATREQPAHAGERQVEQQQELPPRLGRQRRRVGGLFDRLDRVDLAEADDAHGAAVVLDDEVLGAQPGHGAALAVGDEDRQRHDRDVGFEGRPGRSRGRRLRSGACRRGHARQEAAIRRRLADPAARSVDPRSARRKGLHGIHRSYASARVSRILGFSRIPWMIFDSLSA